MIVHIIKKFIYSSSLRKTTLRILNGIHRKSYRMISSLAMAEAKNNVHPKHALMDYHQWFCEQLEKGWEVIDIGCGQGDLASDLAKNCKKVTAIDLNQENIKQASERHKSSNINFVHGDALITPLPQADAVVLSNVLEHIGPRIAFLNKLKELAPRLLIRVPLMDRDWLPLYLEEQGLPWMLDDTHEIEYTQPLLQNELREANYKIEHYRIRYGEIYVVASQSTT